MSERVQNIREIRGVDGSSRRATRIVERDDEPAVVESRTDSRNTAAQLVWFVAGVLLAILGLRFIFALLGANPTNAFANFIYTVSHPFVAPFFSLFSYNLRYGISRFESFTLVAMAVYALLAWGIARLITIDRRPAVE